MDRIIFDTDIYSEIIKGKNQNIVNKAITYRITFGYYAISTITVMEIVKGFRKIGHEDYIQRFLNSLISVELLTLDLQSSELAGRIYADLDKIGQTIGRADPMIAAIALSHNLTLITGNTSHYQRIQSLGYGLKVDNWR